MCGALAREQFAKSDAWKRARPGFVPALEALPGLSMGNGVYAGDYLQNDDDGYDDGDHDDCDGDTCKCAACWRKHSRGTCELIFKGIPYVPDYRFGTKCAASSPFACLCA